MVSSFSLIGASDQYSRSSRSFIYFVYAFLQTYHSILFVISNAEIENLKSVLLEMLH